MWGWLRFGYMEFILRTFLRNGAILNSYANIGELSITYSFKEVLVCIFSTVFYVLMENLIGLSIVWLELKSKFRLFELTAGEITFYGFE